MVLLVVVTSSSLLQAYKPNDKKDTPKIPKVKFLILFILNKIYAVCFYCFIKLLLINSFTGNPLQSGCILCLRKTSIRDYWLSETNFYLVLVILFFRVNLTV